MAARQWQALSDPKSRLGLALSGGGFRSSFFHIGVLRRLAELDLLRYVKILSTVSGGSIVGAHYCLLLREFCHRTREPSRDDYVRIIDVLEAEFTRGVAKDLRNRLFLNPIENLRMFCWASSLGRRMAGLYNRHLYGPVTARLESDRIVTPMAGTRLSPAVSLEDSAVRFDAEPDPAAGTTSRTEGGGCLAELTLKGAEVTVTLANGSISVKESDVTLTNTGTSVEEDAEVTISTQQLRVADRQGGDTEASYDLSSSPSYGDLCLDGKKLEFGMGFTQRQIDEGRLTYVQRDLGAASDSFSFNLRDPQTGRRIWPHTVYFRIAVRPRAIRPLLILNATSLDTGRAFRFAQSWVGETARGTTPETRALPRRVALAEAVAASANFPPVFPPYIIGEIEDPATGLPVTLTDGGVIDNEGIDALIDARCTHIIASDAGAVFDDNRPLVTEDRLALLGRVLSIVTEQIRRARKQALLRQLSLFQWFREKVRKFAPPEFAGDIDSFEREVDSLSLTAGVAAVAMFGLDSDPREAQPSGAVPPHPLAAELGRIRTDLDACNHAERMGLMYQGYQLCDRFVRQHLVGYTTAPSQWPPAPERYRAWSGDNPANRSLLESGRHRAILARLLTRFPRLKGWLIVAVLVACALGIWLSSTGYLGALGAAAGRYLALALSWNVLDPFGLFRGPHGLWWLLLLAATYAALVGLRPAGAGGKEGRPGGTIPKLRSVAYRGRRNLSWLLGPIPVAIALLGSVYAFLAIVAGRVVGVAVEERSAASDPARGERETCDRLRS